MSREIVVALAALLALAGGVRAQEDFKLTGGPSTDLRLGRLHEFDRPLTANGWLRVAATGRADPARNYNNYFPMTVPATKEAWEQRRQELREQLLVVLGLWPMPEKTPLNTTIHGKIDRDDYTIEKVIFCSTPGHYVTGNLYRPKDHVPNKGKDGKRPAVLCPHGHWANGRLYEATEKEIEGQLKGKGEETEVGAKYPLQVRCSMLARMGCVVFFYDMVGVADSTVIPHREGFRDATAELRFQSYMGLQTWNSIRAFDFLSGLDDVDARRVGVTGASGGGTQTFILCAIDDRPAVAFPAVMVSTAMQGGCVCENCSGLRIDAGNIDIAALMAPRPLAMSGAHDWTIDIERKGLPELKALYKLYGAEDKVEAKCFPQFQHNYNQVSREMMYGWFNKHLQLGFKEPVKEKAFEPVAPRDLSVYDENHKLPKDALKADKLREQLGEASDKQIAALMPKDDKGLKEYRRVVGTALRVMLMTSLPGADDLDCKEVGKKYEGKEFIARQYLLGRKGHEEAVPAVGLCGKDFNGTVVVWVHPQGRASLFDNGKLVPEARKILDGKAGILAIDAFQTGSLTGQKMAIDRGFAGYTFGYNRTLVARRSVHDILTAVAFAKQHEKAKVVDLAGFEEAGPWVLLAHGLCGDTVTRTAADMAEFRFENVKQATDDMMLPGAVKYGGMGGLAALAAPGELWVHHHAGTGSGKSMKAAYDAAGAGEKLKRTQGKAKPEEVAEWLLR